MTCNVWSRCEHQTLHRVRGLGFMRGTRTRGGGLSSRRTIGSIAAAAHHLATLTDGFVAARDPWPFWPHWPTQELFGCAIQTHLQRCYQLKGITPRLDQEAPQGSCADVQHLQRGASSGADGPQPPAGFLHLRRRHFGTHQDQIAARKAPCRLEDSQICTNRFLHEDSSQAR